METLTYSGQLAIETCWCGMVHGVPIEMVKHQQREHREGRKQTGIYCPLGHVWIRSGPGESERLKEKLAHEQARTTLLRGTVERERRRHAATKGQLTKAKKRAARGICPCCTRSFVNVQRHIEGQHPDYLEATK